MTPTALRELRDVADGREDLDSRGRAALDVLLRERLELLDAVKQALLHFDGPQPLNREELVKYLRERRDAAQPDPSDEADYLART